LLAFGWGVVCLFFRRMHRCILLSTMQACRLQYAAEIHIHNAALVEWVKDE
jgi:hypothetical protein